jgi:hypothetical protein
LYTFKKYESGNYVITELQIYDNWHGQIKPLGDVHFLASFLDVCC